MFRNLSTEETKEFRQWAQDNYTPGHEINELWHPVVRNECWKMNYEAFRTFWNQRYPYIYATITNKMIQNEIELAQKSVKDESKIIEKAADFMQDYILSKGLEDYVME